MNYKNPIKVLIIDDSSYNRRAISDFLKDLPQVVVVGKACDGQEGLQLAHREKPDVITLDLEMPRLDGFSFLRLIMASRPTPVIVISSHSKKENVFKALELGAFDFVAKPTSRISPEILEIKQDVIQKVLVAGNLRPGSLKRLSAITPSASPVSNVFSCEDQLEKTNRWETGTPRLIAIAASTGGPQAITQILSELPGDLQAAIVIVQHMPSRFTTTFAQRLNRQCSLLIKELYLEEQLQWGNVYIAPGDKDLTITCKEGINSICAVNTDSSSRYCPSADRMFKSAAHCFLDKMMAVVLTGMGDDGAKGAEAVFASGGKVVVESPSTAVLDGMPRAAIETGIQLTEVSLNQISKQIIRFAQ